MASTFISYRRDDAPGYAGRIYDRFVQSFGRAEVFLDVDRIDPGADFEQVIKQRLAQCAVFLAIIGPRWLEKGPGRQLPRIFEDMDFVRVELRSALAAGARVIPVLVAGASLPRSVELPMDIAPLVRRQAVVLGDSDFHHDVGNLITLVAGILGKQVDGSVAGAAEQPVSPEQRAPEPRAPEPHNPVANGIPPIWITLARTLWSWLTGARRRAIQRSLLLLLLGSIGLYVWDQIPASDREKLTEVVTNGKDLLGLVVGAEASGSSPGNGLPSPGLPTAITVERSAGAVLDPTPVSNGDFARWLNLRRPTLSIEEAAVGGVVGQVVRDPSGPLAALYNKDHPVFSASAIFTNTAGAFRTLNTWGARPARAISWPAANAYCRDQGKRLPTADEWLPPAGSDGKRPIRPSTIAREWLAQERQVITTAPSTTPTTTSEPPNALPADVGFRCAR